MPNDICASRAMTQRPRTANQALLGELDRNAGGRDALQRSAADVDATDAVDFKIEADDRVGVIVLRFANQRLERRQTIVLARGAPNGAGLDAADQIMAAGALKSMATTDLLDFYRWSESETWFPRRQGGNRPGLIWASSALELCRESNRERRRPESAVERFSSGIAERARVPSESRK